MDSPQPPALSKTVFAFLRTEGKGGSAEAVEWGGRAGALERRGGRRCEWGQAEELRGFRALTWLPLTSDFTVGGGWTSL